MSTPTRVLAGLTLIIIAVVLYIAASHTTLSSVVFALLLLAGFGFIAQALLRR